MRKRRKVFFTHKRHRSILTDMLPFEVPPTFSNRGFYRFLKEHAIEIVDNSVSWNCESSELDLLIKLIFGFSYDSKVTIIELWQWGSKKTIRQLPLSKSESITIPFNFKVAHNIEGRTLSVIHPRNQLQVASFYVNRSALITYYNSLSNFSIRKPVSVSTCAFYNDRLHELKLEKPVRGLELADREYEQLGSFFTYEKYRNIHNFFESYKYHRCEKKYDAMMQIDISKCFDSIYTHSLPWSIFGKEQIKADISKSGSTFGGEFDSLMQRLNHNETNGIVIGPEFSRIFAEIILQSIDVEVEQLLEVRANLRHRSDYEIFRYVDDYFVFYNKDYDHNQIINTIQEVLKSKKLNINAAKLKFYEKPIITEITLAKQKITEILNQEIQPTTRVADNELESTSQTDAPHKLECKVDSNRLIIRYKTAIKESDVAYGDLINYTFAIIENKIDSLFSHFKKSERSLADSRILAEAIKRILEVAFFIYSACPKVNHTIRICRMISTTVFLLHDFRIENELKHLVFKYVHENILQQLKKNTINSNREVESLYLLLALLQIGKEYWLPEELLAQHFKIDFDKATNTYSKKDTLNHFSITVLLSYLKDKKRYESLRNFIEELAIQKLHAKSSQSTFDAESILLFLDLIVCPFIKHKTRIRLSKIFKITEAELESIRSINNYWFTAWGDNFNLTFELDAKRSREVY